MDRFIQDLNAKRYRRLLKLVVADETTQHKILELLAEEQQKQNGGDDLLAHKAE